MEELSEEIRKQCRLKAMHLLEYSDRTEKQLRDKLEERGFSPQAVDDAIEYVRSFHYIDDRRYAESYIRTVKGSKSIREMREKLTEKGISREILDEVLEEQENELDEKENIRVLFLKKYGSKDLSDPKMYEKAIRYFMSKGYRYGNIRDAVTEALEAGETGSDT